ncbi:MAG: hypothetical protein A4E52_01850 [Pelotomaculum sp. PtaB.Bin013]|nr:MAG: hypothetical protein A4E52_01850 [Pelotomaculum sp. PtaB.Bin013]
MKIITKNFLRLDYTGLMLHIPILEKITGKLE